MKALGCASALLLLGLGGEARAASYAWCQVAGGNYESYLSKVVEIEDGREAFGAFLQGPFPKAFREHVQASIDPRASSLDCTREDSLLFANDRIDVLIETNPGIRFIRTGWSGPIRSAAKPDRARRDKDTALAKPAPKPAEAKPAEPKQEALAMPASGKPIEPQRIRGAGPKPQWEVDYEQKLAVYEQEIAKQQQAVADYERIKTEIAAKQAELRAKAEKANADWKAAVAECRAGNRSACAGTVRR